MGNDAGMVSAYRRLVAELLTVALTQSPSDIARAKAAMAVFVEQHYEARRLGSSVSHVIADAREQIIRNLSSELGDDKARFFADAPLELLWRAVHEVMDELREERQAVADASGERLTPQGSVSYLSR